MAFSLLLQLLTFTLDLLTLARRSTAEKDLEILLLRQQIRILQRKAKGRTRPTPSDRLILAALSFHIKRTAGKTNQRLQEILLLFKPETVLRWHHQLVRRKWTFKSGKTPGRPRLAPEIEALIVRLALENRRWGYDRIQGELLKLGYTVSPASVRNVLKRNRISPISRRPTGSWRSFLRHYRDQMLACDFFTVETVTLKTIYVLFFIELGSRRVRFAGCTAHPDRTWITQQARQVVWELSEREQPIKYLIHDRDTKFCSAFDAVFVSEGIETIRTPFRAPKANAFAERWVRSVREECLDHILVINEAHLTRVLREYVRYYNNDRPHQGIRQGFPVSQPKRNTKGPILRKNVLGGIIHDYYRRPIRPESGPG